MTIRRRNGGHRLKRAAWLLAAAAPLCSVTSLQAQETTAPPTASQTPQPAPTAGINAPDPTQKTVSTIELGGPVQAEPLRQQRKAAKFYLRGVKLLAKQQPEPAWNLLKQAVEIEPNNQTYVRASELARQSAVTQLVQQAGQAKQNIALGIDSQPAQLLHHALEIDPQSETARQRLHELAAESDPPPGMTASKVLNPQAAAGEDIAEGIKLEPQPGKHSFHLKTSQQQAIKEVFKAYGLEASIDESVHGQPVRIEVEDATFPEAAHILGLTTHTFYEPLDPHRVIVATDTRENHTKFQRLQMETVYLPGLTDKELTDVANLARNVFDAQQSVAEPNSGTITLRAPAKAMVAFNRTVSQLVDGKAQVDLNVKIIELAHTSSRNTGTTFLQSTTVANAYTEIQSILNANQSAVQQIIASGLVPNDIGLTNQLTIIGILLASGTLSGSSILTSGFALFGGGITESALGPSPATLNLQLNSSDTRTLDDIHMRLADQEDGTFKTGERYPIETSSYSSVAISAISALTGGAGNQTIPQIQYEDLGLTIKATPSILRSDDVALKLDIKIEALGGTSLNDIPILDSRNMSGVLTLKAGETAVMLSDITKSQSRALSGLPGVSDIPGLQDISDINRNTNVARLLIIITPRVVRENQQLAHSPRMPVEKSSGAH